MNDRERFLACVLGEPVDRPPFYLYFDPWESTWEKWKQQGKPDDVKDFRFPFETDVPPLPLPINTGACPAFEEAVLEEETDSKVVQDEWGIKKRVFKGKESMPHFIEFPVKNRRDWEQYKEERLDPDHPGRFTEDCRDAGQSWAMCGLTVQLGKYPDTGVFGGLRWLMGDEECLMAFCTMPDLVHEIMDHLTSLYLTVFEKVVREVPCTLIHIWEDMCGKQGPLISPRQWEEFMGPQYRRIQAFAKEHDIRVISVDTDGQPDLIVPCMMDAGVNFLFPFEVAAGCDVNEFRRKYPTLAMMGGIDKRALVLGPKAIDAELERIKPAVEGGRYIPELDHTIPDNVTWDNWCYFAESLKRLAGKE